MMKKVKPDTASAFSSTGSVGRDLERRRRERLLHLLAADAGLAQRLGGAHLAVGGLEQGQEVVGRLLGRLDAPAADHGVDRAVVERGPHVPGGDLVRLDLDVDRGRGPRGRLHDGALGRAGVADVVGLVAAAQHRGQDHDQHDDDQVHGRRHEERLLAHALGDLAPGDERDGLATAHSATASRNRSVRVGRSSAK